MKIAWFVPGGFAPDDTGDHNPVLRDLAERTAASVDLHVFSYSSFPTGRIERSGDLTVRFLPVHVRAHPLKRFRSLYAAFLEEHTSSPFDLIHAFWALPSGVHAMTIGGLKDIPTMVTLPGGDTAGISSIGYGNMLSLRSRMLTRLVCRHASRVHLLTDFQYDQLLGNDIHPASALVCPIGVDPSLFDGVPADPQPPFNILHVSNLTEVKDQITLLRAFALLTGRVAARLRIVGPDHMSGALQRASLDLGIQDTVDFTGRLPRRDLRAQYTWAHLYVHSSLHEGQSVSVVEAMACGTPACGTHVGLLSDLSPALIETVLPGDHQRLSSLMLGMLEDKDRYADRAFAAQQWAHRHTIELTRDTIVAAYDELIRRREA